VHVAEKTEQLLAQALDASGYHVVEHFGPLKEGAAGNRVGPVQALGLGFSCATAIRRSVFA